MNSIRLTGILALALGMGVVQACGSSTGSQFNGGNQDAGNGSSSGGPDDGSTPPVFVGGDGSAGDASGLLVITPADVVLSATVGQPPPTQQFNATFDGSPTAAGWTVDRGEIGTINATTGLFTASGTVGGIAHVIASLGSNTVSTTITVNLHQIENGDPGFGMDAGAGDAGTGAGGLGGVGGHGPGGPVDSGTQVVLSGAATSDGAALLYPYNKTVWPRGILAPLLMWQPGSQGDYDAVYIHLSETAFDYKGYFSKNSSPFQDYAVPNDVWKSLAESNAGEPVNVTITLAHGGQAYGPLTSQWIIASAPLKGTVYYNSYGTHLAQNYSGAKGPTSAFGGATLGIRGTSTDPYLVAGSTGDATHCRVCHSVSADGSTLMTQRWPTTSGGYASSGYALAGPTETPSNTIAPWPAVYPDGTFYLTDSSALASSSASTPSALFMTPTGGTATTPTPITAVGLNNLSAAMPVFSADGKNLAYNFYGGVTGADQISLALSTFTLGTYTFGAPQILYTPTTAGYAAVWPSFMPTNDSIVFQQNVRYNGRDFGGTRADQDSGAGLNIGAEGELWWIDLKTKTPTRLDNADGKGYAPTLAATQHTDDSVLNYEPTVNPVPSGGYAWVVFTSRRLYGNVATINPWWSDPRNVDISSTPTTKKLWVAAIDLNAPAGTDPSHPAFYLPAQELLAGNSRGYWVVDPCEKDGSSCDSGDECCGGYCQPGTSGALVCTQNKPTCAQEFEKCTTSSDCCGAPAIQCLNNRCSAESPPK